GPSGQLWRGEKVINPRRLRDNAPEPTRGPLRRWTRFWLTPSEPTGLHILRLLAGLLFAAWLLSFAGARHALFGLAGWFDRQAYLEASRMGDGAPVPISWSLLYLCHSPAAFDALYWGALCVFVLFALGIATRITGVLSWLLVASFIVNPATSYDAD